MDTASTNGAALCDPDPQAVLEQESIEDGRTRYYSAAKRVSEDGAALFLAPVRTLFDEKFATFVAHLTTIRASFAGIPAQSVPRYVPWIVKVGAEAAAAITLQETLSNIGLPKGSRVNTIASAISRQLVCASDAISFRTEQPKLYNAAVREMREAGSYEKFEVALKRSGCEREDSLDAADRLRIGVGFIEALFVATESAPLFEIPVTEIETAESYGRRRVTTRKLLVPTTTTLARLQDDNERLAVLAPREMPMLVPPLPYTADQRGGYRSALKDYYPLVRGTTADPAGDLSEVRNAVNTVAAVAWTINQRVLAMVERALAGEVNVASVPRDPEPPAVVNAPAPWTDDATDDEVELRKQDVALHAAYTQAKKEYTKRLKINAGKRNVVAQAVRIAKRIGTQQHYYPQSVDWRGRVYPIPTSLNNAGSDPIRALLQFASGCEINETNVLWLKVALAGHWGKVNGIRVGSLTFDERAALVDEWSETILAIAADPLVNTLWTTVDSPFQFLAACSEFAEWQTTGKLLSHLPIPLDASMSGTQHQSAMLRDPVGARNVNLTNDRPQDFYGHVAAKLRERLLASDAPEAKAWMAAGEIDRSLVKRPVMTTAYGSTIHGQTGALFDYVFEDPAVWASFVGACKAYEVKPKKTCAWLIAELQFVLASEAGGTLKVRDWLQAAATAVVLHTDRSVSWTSPTGLLVTQHSFTKTPRRVSRIPLAGGLYSPLDFSTSNAIDTTAVQNGISPNVTHSFDAAHLHRTVNGLAREGVQTIGVIHDSFAVLASDVPKLATSLREAFISIYSTNQLERLATDWRETGATIPDVPALGTWDVTDVQSAQFMFA